ncbi:MAG: hypothetical protein IPL61_05095 [Myxococcales bacterium]|nr:hypothetical protein [Myxococcales bacterium]
MIRWWAGAALVLAIVVALGGRSRADDATDQAAFTAAAQRLAAGDAVGARAAFEALAAAAPTGRWADDALAEAAALAEQAGDLTGARALWGRIVAEHADGRLARRAQARLDALVAAGGRDGRFDALAAEHERLVRAAGAAEDPHAALAALAAMLDEHLDYPRWFAAALWLGEAWGRIGERDRAATWLARAAAAAPGPRERFRAELAQADLAAAAGDFARARRLIAALTPPDDAAAAARDELAVEVARRAGRRRLRLLAWGLLVALAVAAAVVLRVHRRSWRAAARGLWPPPVEVAYLAPVALGLALVAETGNPMAARAVEHILLGAVTLAWTAGAVTRAWARPGVVVRIGFALAVLAAVAAVVWLAVDDDQLLDLLLETWRSGHDLR